jgi:shikimate dehydrogenase
VADPRAAEIVVNATSVGLAQNIDPFKAIPLKADTFGAGSCVIDLAYGSGETRFLAAARSRGARVIDGLEILVAQGVASFERWTGKMAPRQAMRGAVTQSPSS